jgi:hypothetical protein
MFVDICPMGTARLARSAEPQAQGDDQIRLLQAENAMLRAANRELRAEATKLTAETAKLRAGAKQAAHGVGESATQPSAATGPAPSPKPRAGSRVSPEKAMEMAFKPVDFKDKPLGDVIVFLRDTSGADIHVNWGALAAAGVTDKTPVTLNTKASMTLRKLLELILRQAGASTDRPAGVDLRFGAHGDLVIISTREDLANMPVRRVYDIGPLIAGSKNRDAAIAQIVAAIRAKAEPESWGEFGSISVFNDRLIIITSIFAHESISDLLKQLAGKAGGRR